MSLKSLLPAFASLLPLLFSACSDKTNDNPLSPDAPLPENTQERRSIVLDNTSFPFIKVPMPSGDSVWIGETEVTVGHYTRIMGPAYLASTDPKPLNWYQAALYTNLLSRAADSLLPLSTDTTIRNRYTILKSGGHGFSALYDTSAGIQTFRPPVVRIAALAFAADAVWRFPSDTFPATPDTLRMSGAVAAKIFRSRLCTVVIGAGAPRDDRLRVLTALLAQKPDSILSTAAPSTPAVFKPHELENGTALSQLLADSSAHTLTACKRSFRLSGGSAIVNAPAVPETLFNTPLVRIVKADSLLDSADRNLRLFYFAAMPLDTAFRALSWAISIPAPCTVTTHPLAYAARVWKRNVNGWGFRLPTNAEWEAAARCAPQNLTYSTRTGTLTLTTAVYNTAAFKPVRSTDGPNPFGLHDMTGNLAEWITDYWTQYGAYLQPDTATAADLARPPHRVVKGGHFACTPTDSTLKTAVQRPFHPDSLDANRIGFRLAISGDAVSDTLWNALPR